MGRTAARAVLSKKTGMMAGIKRIANDPYAIEATLIPIEEVMLTEKTLPDHFINSEGNGVTEAFLDWLRPLVSSPPEHISFLRRN